MPAGFFGAAKHEVTVSAEMVEWSSLEGTALSAVGVWSGSSAPLAHTMGFATPKTLVDAVLKSMVSGELAAASGEMGSRTVGSRTMGILMVAQADLEGRCTGLQSAEDRWRPGSVS